MCGRYSQLRPWSELVHLYRITETRSPVNLPARYNIAPTQDVPVVRRRGPGDDRELVLLRWGLIPSWAKEVAIGAKMINARAESVGEKPAFRTAFARRRCLVVADGFYEWQVRPAGPKQPYFITLADHRPLAFAGLWEAWSDRRGETIDSCTIITTEANAPLRAIHDRMPAILVPEDFDRWLDPRRGGKQARALLTPYAGEMLAYPVSRRVNDVHNDDPGCIEPTGG